jgi:hypothetical protein
MPKININIRLITNSAAITLPLILYFIGIVIIYLCYENIVHIYSRIGAMIRPRKYFMP